YAEQAKQLLANKKSDIEEAERKAAEEAEAKRKAEQEASQASNNGNSNGNSGSSGGSGSGDNSGGNSPPASNSSSGFITPVSGHVVVTSGFGPRKSPGGIGSTYHNGLDFAPPNSSTPPIISAKDGVVSHAGWMGGYGNTVMITHGDVTTLYAHMSSINVSAGQVVKQGQQIGIMGTTGNSTGVHLHFEVHPGGYKNPVNPSGYLP